MQELFQIKNQKLNRALYAIDPIYDSLDPAGKWIQTQAEHILGFTIKHVLWKLLIKKF